MRLVLTGAQLTRQLLVAGGLACIILSAIYWIISHAFPAGSPNSALLIPVAARQLSPEPIERSLYLISLIALPMLLMIIVRLSPIPRIGEGRWGNSGWEVIRSSLISLFLILPLPLSLGIRAIMGEAGFRDATTYSHFLLACTGAICSTIVILWAKRRRLQLPRGIRRLVNIVVVGWGCLTVCLGLLSFRIFSFSHLSGSAVWSDHLDAVISSVSQVRAGHTLLVDAPSQYGLFPELLSPILNVMPAGVMGLTLSFGILQVISMLCVMAFMRRRIRNPLVLAAGYGALTMVTFGLHSLCGLRFSEPDPVFQYWPVRFVAPALSLPLVGWVTKKLSWQRVVVLGCWCGLCLFWNLDSGAAVMYAATMLFALLTGLRLSGIAIGSWSAISLSLATISVPILSAFSYSCGLIWLAIRSGGPMVFKWIIGYQSTFYGLGFGMLPLPAWPDAWVVVITGYTIAILISLQRLRDGRRPGREAIYLYVPLLGLGLFSYFQGRSHFFNLVAVSWPMIVIAAILIDRHLLGISKGLIPTSSCTLSLVGLMTLFLPTLGLILCYPTLLRKGMRPSIHQPDAFQMAAPYLSTELEMVRRYCSSSQPPCLILSLRQGIYALEAHTASALKGPSPAEMLLKKDKEDLISQIKSGRSRRILLGIGPSILRHLLPLDEVFRYYEAKEINKEGTMLLMEHRTSQ